MIKQLERLKQKIDRNKPYYLLKQTLCTELKSSPLKNALLQTYELGIPADLLLNKKITDVRVENMTRYLVNEFFMEESAAKLIVNHWIFLLELDDYNNTLENTELESEFLNDDNEVTHSKVRLVGYKDIEVENDAFETDDKLLSEIFLEGLKNGNIDKVKKAVENGFSIDFKDKGNRDALIMWMTKKGYLDILSYLIEKGLDIKNRFENGRTALMYVVKTEHVNIFEYLISLGLGINDKDNNGKTVLMYATENGHLPLIKRLVDCGADINIGTAGYKRMAGRYYSFGKTALMYAVASKNIEVIEYLIEMGADIFATKHGVRANRKKEIRHYGKNIIMYAVEHGDIKLVKYLVSKGASLTTARDEFRNSPLNYAVIKKDLAMIKYLLKKGVSINKMNKDFLNPLIYAIRINEINIVKLLVTEGAILDGELYVNKEGDDLPKPIHYAIKEGNDDVIKYLISEPIDFNAKDTDGKTPLMYAIEKNDIKLIKVLLNNKVNIEAVDHKGNNAFWYAVKENNNKIISILENHIKRDYR